jgi:AcrR family transcriptional regulator
VVCFDSMPTLTHLPDTEGSRLTRERILAAAEEVMLRHGPDKATVVDVARVLGVNHANLYKFFASKSDLRRAVVEAWLDRMDAPLARIVAQRGSPETRLRRWLDAFVGARRSAWRDEPELFLALRAIAAEQPPAVWREYKARLYRSIAAIVAEGMALGVFKVADAEKTAAALINAFVRFYHPVHYREWADPGQDEAYKTLRQLLLAGLTCAETPS